jgi:hypothetical protein
VVLEHPTLPLRAIATLPQLMQCSFAVAADEDREVSKRLEENACLFRPRPPSGITETDDSIDVRPVDLCQDRGQGRRIAVNVGDHGDAAGDASRRSVAAHHCSMLPALV